MSDSGWPKFSEEYVSRAEFDELVKHMMQVANLINVLAVRLVELEKKAIQKSIDDFDSDHGC
jgi:hypothetical protein